MVGLLGIDIAAAILCVGYGQGHGHACWSGFLSAATLAGRLDLGTGLPCLAHWLTATARGIASVLACFIAMSWLKRDLPRPRIQCLPAWLACKAIDHGQESSALLWLACLLTYWPRPGNAGLHDWPANRLATAKGLVCGLAGCRTSMTGLLTDWPRWLARKVNRSPGLQSLPNAQLANFASRSARNIVSRPRSARYRIAASLPSGWLANLASRSARNRSPPRYRMTGLQT